MSAIVSGVLTALEPWKAVIASVAGFLAALLGILGGMLKQRRVANVTSAEQITYSPRVTSRLHPDDLRAIDDLARVTRLNTDAVKDNTEALGEQTEAIKRLSRGRGRQ